MPQQLAPRVRAHLHEIADQKSISDRRWCSRSITNLLLDMRNYDAAAEVVIGSIAIFQSYSREINRSLFGESKVSAGLALVLAKAREEIAYHQLWQSTICSRLPVDDESGLTRLRDSFSSSSAARSALLLEVMQASDWLPASSRNQ
jgi:hypothetical protein